MSRKLHQAYSYRNASTLRYVIINKLCNVCVLVVRVVVKQRLVNSILARMHHNIKLAKKAAFY